MLEFSLNTALAVTLVVKKQKNMIETLFLSQYRLSSNSCGPKY